jgi:hypothetical protein
MKAFGLISDHANGFKAQILCRYLTSPNEKEEYHVTDN